MRVFCKGVKLISRSTLLTMAVLWLSGCSLLAPAPPDDQTDVCEIFAEQPDWYDYARSSQKKWGTPIATQMAFIQKESSFRSHVRPDREWLLGIIPWMRPSSAYGYAQAQDPVWGEYLAETGTVFSRRTHMKHATDFIGWYNKRSQKMLNIPLTNAGQLYLAYHEGQGGYARGSYKAKPQVRRSAAQVASMAKRYSAQLQRCEAQLRCDKFYQVWPFCR